MSYRLPVMLVPDVMPLMSPAPKGPWVMGESYTICDPYLFTLAQWMEGDGVDPGRYPKVLDHRTRVGERAAVKRALAARG